MRQEIYEDPFDLNDWEIDQKSRCFVHIANSLVWRAITGEAPPTVAHELAHVYLEHPQTASMIEGFRGKEREVDEQVIKWGFESELRQAPFNNIYGQGSIQNESSVDAI